LVSVKKEKNSLHHYESGLGGDTKGEGQNSVMLSMKKVKKGKDCSFP
jgi:hypothetical protein